MTIEEAEAKKAFLAKAYFLSSFATLCAVLYQVKKGRLNWIESEGLIPENEAKLSPGESTILLMVFHLIIHTNNYISF